MHAFWNTVLLLSTAPILYNRQSLKMSNLWSKSNPQCETTQGRIICVQAYVCVRRLLHICLLYCKRPTFENDSRLRPDRHHISQRHQQPRLLIFCTSLKHRSKIDANSGHGHSLLAGPSTSYFGVYSLCGVAWTPNPHCSVWLKICHRDYKSGLDLRAIMQSAAQELILKASPLQNSLPQVLAKCHA